MKIVWVKPGKLLPLDSGGKLRTYNIARQLSKKHDITFVSYYGGTRDEIYEQELKQMLPSALPVHSPVLDITGIKGCFGYARHLARSAPYAVTRFTSRRVRELLAEWIPERRFDAAICDFLASAPHLPKQLATPTVLFQHNVESVLWKRRSQFAARGLQRLVASVEAARMIRYETSQVRRFHHVFAVSEQDRNAMSTMTDSSRISVIPTGVDREVYRYDPEQRPSRPLVVFSGSMDWEPNVDGVEFFCKEIWPIVLSAVPEAIFRIVGRDPRPRVRELACESVEVTGTVPSIVNHLREAAVLVVPLRIGGGTRIKIYEGMAMGKATVSTSVGAEGLNVHHGCDILLADEPERFAAHVVNLLRNENVRREYEKAAAAAPLCDWSSVADLFAKELQRIILRLSLTKRVNYEHAEQSSRITGLASD